MSADLGLNWTLGSDWQEPDCTTIFIPIGFYTNRLNGTDAAYHLGLGREFVMRLIEMTETYGNRAGTV